MAWQLIYTSAPRLLEAGRTGFGTVARHRAVGELVAGAVERLSQFARLAGLGARRVVRSHRIITAGASQVHVFSCIRDAGSDYTGRTNHLAHHLIAEAREVRMAAEAGITPADILMQMHWRTSWSESPRFFEPLEEVSLMSLRARMLGSAWEHLIGSANFNALPLQTPRCFIILPGETDALPLIQESLKSMGAESAQVSFTTQLEPTDDVAGLRWVAMNASSPLRQQADGIARAVLNLTQAQSLPKLVNASKEPAIRSSRESLLPINAQSYPAIEMSLPSVTAPSSFMEALHPLPKARSGSFAAIMLTAVLLIGAGITAYFWLDQQTKQQSPRTAVDLAKRVDELWQKHRLALPMTSIWLKGQANAGLIESHDKALRLLMQSLREPLQLIDIPRPESTQDEFMDMLQSYSQWQRFVSDSARDAVWSGEAVTEIKIQARVRLDQEDRLWKKFSTSFERVPLHPDVLRQEISAQVLKRMNQTTAPNGVVEDWCDIITMTLIPRPPWPDLWVRISRFPAFPAALAISEQAILREAAEDSKVPPWLQQFAQKRLQQCAEMSRTDAEVRTATQAAQKTSQAELQITAADGPTSMHPRYIIFKSAEEGLSHALEKLPDLPVQDDMQIIAGAAGFSESNLMRWRALGGPGVYRKSFIDSMTLEIRDKRLIKVPTEQDSWRILGRSSTGSSVLFEVLFLAWTALPTEVWHTHPAFSFQSQHNGQHTLLDGSAARWLSQISFIGAPSKLRLQSIADPARLYCLRLEADQAVVENETKQQRSAVAVSRVTAISAEIENLKQGIRIDQQRQVEIAEGNLAKREKEESQTRSQEAISNKERRIMEMEEEVRGLTALTAEPAPLVGIPSGRYSLMVILSDPDGRENASRLCELTITSQ